jgi:hypothetical protein
VTDSRAAIGGEGSAPGNCRVENSPSVEQVRWQQH